jgi:hypothetical protein
MVTRDIICVLLVIGSMNTAGCSQRAVDSEKGSSMSQKTIEQVQQEHTRQWLTIPGVEGTAIGLFEGKRCITIFTSVKADELRNKIPSQVEGYPIVIKETGTFRALEEK